MTPGALQPVMNRLIHRTTSRASQSHGGVVDVEDDETVGRTKVDADQRLGALSPRAFVKRVSIGASVPAHSRRSKPKSTTPIKREPGKSTGMAVTRHARPLIEHVACACHC